MSKKIVHEKEIQQARWDKQWETMQDLVNIWAARASTASQNSDVVELSRSIFLGEAVMEITLQLQDKHERNIHEPISKQKLKDAYNYLNKAVTFANQLKDEQPTLFEESNLLMAKYYYCVGNYKATCKHVDLAHISQNSLDSLSKRGRLLAAEAFTCKGISLEKLKALPESNVEEDDITKCFEIAGDISLWLFMKEQRFQGDKRCLDSDTIMTPLLHKALMKPGYIYILLGRIDDAINYYRNILRAIETKATVSLRKDIARQLAELLLCGICESNYNAPPVQCRFAEERRPELATSTFHVDIHGSELSAHRLAIRESGKLQSYGSVGMFCPQDEFEETLLLLLISEALMLQEATVNQFPENQDKRLSTLSESCALYDLLSLTLIRRQQYGLLSECLERGVKLAFEEFHLWFQYGLGLICCGKYSKALLVLDRCHQLRTEDATVILFCCKICINHLRKYDDAIEYAKSGLKITHDPITSANFWFATGLSYSLMAGIASAHEEARRLQQDAIEALETAHKLDPNDIDILCQLALTQALAKQLSAAATAVQQCLQLDSSDVNSLLLLTLLLSAQKKYLEALEVLDIAIFEHPEDFNLLQVKVKLVEECYGGEQALSITHFMLQIWSELYDQESTELHVVYEETNKSGSFTFTRKSTSESGFASTTRSLKPTSLAESGFLARSLKQLTLADVSPSDDRIEIDCESSISASVHLERSLSEAAASGTFSSQKLPTHVAVALLSKIWLASADVYLNMGNTEEAANCVNESSSVFPLSPDVLFMKGRLNETANKLSEAKSSYECALVISPQHVQAMQKLAMLYNNEGRTVIAEKAIRDAISIEPANHLSWHILGVVLDSTNQHSEASDCFLTALDLETTSPIVSYLLIPRHFHGDEP